MVPLEALFTLPLDFFLVLLVNGTPAAECTPIVEPQSPPPEVHETFLRCHLLEGAHANIDFYIEPADLRQSTSNDTNNGFKNQFLNEALEVTADSEVTIQVDVL
ncbi:MAG: hypothetical protein AAF810_18850 [Cyanobacteria bacterium P01_D01_bin.36]